MAITWSPPVLCDKIRSGIICTKQNKTDISDKDNNNPVLDSYSKAFDPTTNEVRLYDILPAKENWINCTVCTYGIDTPYVSECSSTQDGPEINDFDLYSNDSYDGDDYDFDFWTSMGSGHWDNNGGSPQWIPSDH
jgi:hypothetical protein